MSMIESLVALMVLALGVLGLAAVQTRMLVEARVTNSRATAVRLIADLSERINLNKEGAQAVVAGGAVTPSAYQSLSVGAPPSVPPAGACDFTAANVVGGACTPASVAAFDVWDWRRKLSTSLMDGIGIVAQDADPRHLRVVVGWRLNENENTNLADELRISFGGGAGDQCPNGYICHLEYIEIPVVR